MNSSNSSVGMDQWWISVQPSSSCKSSTWSSAPQMFSAAVRFNDDRSSTSFVVVKNHLGKQVEILCGSSWFVFFKWKKWKIVLVTPLQGSFYNPWNGFFFWKRSARFFFMWKNCSMMKLRSFFHMFHAILNESMISHHRSDFLFCQFFHLTIVFVSFSCVDSRYP